MSLLVILAIPLVASFLCLISKRGLGITYVSIILNILALVFIYKNNPIEISFPWIPSWSVYWHFSLDFFSFMMILLTLLLSIFATYISLSKNTTYFAALNLAIFAIMGIFLSADIFLFFIFWELALLPIYWILLNDGIDLLKSQAIRFIVLTQISGLLLLIAILGLAFLNFKTSHVFTFEYKALLKNTLSYNSQYWLLILFTSAFLIKLPAIPFHGWMPALFSKGPASAVLINILTKTSIFALVKFSWPLFPDAADKLAFTFMILGLLTLLYGAILAFSKSNPKKVLSYSTLSHAGLLLMGVFCNHEAGYLGVLILVITSSLSTCALLIIFERRRKNLSDFFGLWSTHPKLSVAVLAMLLATMGFPIFGNFVGEWLILWSIFSQNIILSIIASLSIIISAAYGLLLFKRICLSENQKTKNIFPDLNLIEINIIGIILIIIIGLGIRPNLIQEIKQKTPKIASFHEVSP
jgi:NADH-quinone oxidoreductase subunit M